MFAPVAFTAAALALQASTASAGYIAQSFAKPAPCPTCVSDNYVGKNNGSLAKAPVVPGKAFDRFIQIWLENTDYASAATSAVFRNLSSQGITLSSYHGVTHPSQPNYIASVTGDHFGLGNDNFWALPSNVSTIVDLLEAKNISWASYDENLPYDGFTGFNYTQTNYLNATAGNYTYYVRKHNPLIITNSVASIKSRAIRQRNFNDFAVDVNASALPQWMFITPNLVNDGHDTTIQFSSDWLSYFLVPLLQNPLFNNNRTLILLTFDENETYTIENNVYSILLGGAVPPQLKGTTDPTFYTHYSTLATVQANWGLGNLGRNDINTTVNNVFAYAASTLERTLNGLTANSTGLPQLNLTGVFPGPLNTQLWTPPLAPKVVQGTFVANGTSLALTSYTPQNLTALNITNPYSVDPGFNWAVTGNTTSPRNVVRLV